MNYRCSDTTLVIEGDFQAASTGIQGDIGPASALFNHTVPRRWHDDHPERLLAEIAAKEGIGSSYFGMLTAVPMGALVICRSGFLTVFITAGISNHTINIIGVSGEGITRSGLLEGLITAASAKTRALFECGKAIQGTPTDAVIMACEGPGLHRYAGPVTPVGTRLAACVRKGVSLALSRYEQCATVPLTIDIPDHGMTEDRVSISGK
ncbi:adenosylcobinamide amidohydrolase [hydrocarbon metagenome]|uniref:Adenosylcobinamide amidohydrolase n=1 Tax=hydrocarbon metagenome TaxID=938273 RepID=A0A0W8EAM9_9ZZZZ